VLQACANFTTHPGKLLIKNPFIMKNELSLHRFRQFLLFFHESSSKWNSSFSCCDIPQQFLICNFRNWNLSLLAFDVVVVVGSMPDVA